MVSLMRSSRRGSLRSSRDCSSISSDDGLPTSAHSQKVSIGFIPPHVGLLHRDRPSPLRSLPNDSATTTLPDTPLLSWLDGDSSRGPLTPCILLMRGCLFGTTTLGLSPVVPR